MTPHAGRLDRLFNIPTLRRTAFPAGFSLSADSASSNVFLPQAVPSMFAREKRVFVATRTRTTAKSGRNAEPGNRVVAPCGGIDSNKPTIIAIDQLLCNRDRREIASMPHRRHGTPLGRSVPDQ